MKPIIKVMKFLENRGILLKGTARNFLETTRGFLNFLRSLIEAG